VTSLIPFLTLAALICPKDNGSAPSQSWKSPPLSFGECAAKLPGKPCGPSLIGPVSVSFFFSIGRPFERHPVSTVSERLASG